MKKQISILTEAGKNGWGHLSRCTALRESFDFLGIDSRVYCQFDHVKKEDLRNVVSSKWRVNDDVLIDILEKSDLVIVDSYFADADLYKKISKKSRLAVFDDYQRINYPSETIIINAAPGNLQNQYSQYNKTLLGTEYHPFKKAFWKVLKNDTHKEVETITISLGGSDPMNLTARVVDTVLRTTNAKRVNVVIGASFSQSLASELLSSKKVSVFKSVSHEKMVELFSESDLAVVSAGQTIPEVALIGVPSIAIIVADNQVSHAKEWEKIGVVRIIDARNSKNLEIDLSDSLISLSPFENRKTCVKSSIGEIDGVGAIRLAKELYKLRYDVPISVRNVLKKDSSAIFQISNQEDVRSQSLHSSEITKQQHEQWFKHITSDKLTLFYVIESNHEVVGQVRLQREEKSYHPAIISISLAATARGKGYGSILINELLEQVIVQWPDLLTLHAYIKSKNQASLAFFKRHGFVNKGLMTVKKQKVLLLEKEL